ncbi:MAG: replicative DNA helicase [Patescibacteria group bacterium]|nr:replicative DNA helicase [Patescibacteria group bacterium]
MPASPAPKDLPPQNLEAERGVLGSILLDNRVIDDVRLEITRPEDMYRDSHIEILRACYDLHDKGKPVDVITLEEEMLRRGKLEDVGGIAYLLQLASSGAPHAVNATYYAQIVRQKAVKRDVILACHEGLRIAYDDENFAEDVMSSVESGIFAIRKRREQSGVVALSDFTTETIASIHRMISGEFDGLSSGLTELDQILGGFRGSELIVIAARPSMGKSALALNFALNFSQFHGKSTLLFSLEMGRSELAMRWLTTMARVDYHQILEGNVTDSDLRRLDAADASTKSLPPLWVEDTPGITASQIAARCRVLKAKHDIGAVMVDYIGLVAEEPARRNQTRSELLGQITGRLKAVARELNVPVFAIAQLNRNLETRSKEDRRPRMADLRESGAIEQDADKIIFVHRPEYYDANDSPGVAELIVGKNRNGRQGISRVAFVKRFTRFEDFSLADPEL